MLHNDFLKDIQSNKTSRMILFPFSLIFFGIVYFRNLLYDFKIFSIRKLPGKCVSVGSIEVGGSGKTPLVSKIVSILKEENKNLVILSRGYKSGLSSKGVAVLLNEKILDTNESHKNINSDEASMLSAKHPDVPIVISKDRYFGANWFLSKFPRRKYCWILDDGFQHRRLYRDLDIVVVGKNPSRLLPQGILREPYTSLRRSQVVFFSDREKSSCTNKQIQSILQHSNTFNLSFKSLWPRSKKDAHLLDSKRKNICLICGIANPKFFKGSLENLGLTFSKQFFFSDHGSIKKSKILKNFTKDEVIVTTPKDFYRDKNVFIDLIDHIYISELEIKIDKEDYFKKNIIAIFSN
ncbi:MAG: tetraacyldisaccharide 4'-kinase [Zetaproteobacteria bacterium]|nr:tetraacyldisaccharide 4'-kinase [Pseudobdellovibrionaceae bacterium]